MTKGILALAAMFTMSTAISAYADANIQGRRGNGGGGKCERGEPGCRHDRGDRGDHGDHDRRHRRHHHGPGCGHDGNGNGGHDGGGHHGGGHHHKPPRRDHDRNEVRVCVAIDSDSVRYQYKLDWPTFATVKTRALQKCARLSNDPESCWITTCYLTRD